jgi:hypothetical protein
VAPAAPVVVREAEEDEGEEQEGDQREGIATAPGGSRSTHVTRQLKGHTPGGGRTNKASTAGSSRKQRQRGSSSSSSGSSSSSEGEGGGGRVPWRGRYGEGPRAVLGVLLELYPPQVRGAGGGGRGAGGGGGGGGGSGAGRRV